ncbi:DUF1801 domain-containing protein [Rhabdothermincola sp.]|uniref:DUF1801 domain-containing protein n=1 Tax=Rhabdothermincola sp. TaxID=2820405 RepID=UPI002FE24C5C
MPKARKPVSSRRPPVPATSHEVIDDWMREVMPAMVPLVRAVDELIRATITDLHYAVKWSKAHYGVPGLGWVIELAAYHRSINVVFFGGADLAPPPPLGDTDRSRYVKLFALEEIARPQLRAWIEQAGRTPGWGEPPA